MKIKCKKKSRFANHESQNDVSSSANHASQNDVSSSANHESQNDVSSSANHESHNDVSSSGFHLPTILPDTDRGVMSIPCCMKAPEQKMGKYEEKILLLKGLSREAG